jgi:hypothetical protein
MNTSYVPGLKIATQRKAPWWRPLALFLVGGLVLLIVLPQFMGRDPRSKEEWTRDEIKSNLVIIRDRIKTYKERHNGNLPASTSFWDDVLEWDRSLNRDVETISVNPINGQTGVGTAPSPKVGWVYIVSGSDFTVKGVDTSGTGLLSY